MATIKRVPVAFNLDDVDQQRMYEHATQNKNFSGYMKRLIDRDINSVTTPIEQIPNNKNIDTHIQEESTAQIENQEIDWSVF